MQEDILGTRRTAISETYVNCMRCGKVIRLRHARIIKSNVLSETPISSSSISALNVRRLLLLEKKTFLLCQEPHV